MRQIRLVLVVTAIMTILFVALVLLAVDFGPPRIPGGPPL